ncbi:MAG: GNAT family N-acetyltransferase [Anaerolineaceae bacterium]|nr:GNAT family N-acetyltransferase [Anaerolineaceae bacterium]
MMLNTERLLLRELEQSDVPVLYRYNLHPDFRRYEDGPPVTEYQFYQIIQDVIAEQHEHPRRSYYFALVRHSDAQLIGSCYIAIRQPEARQAEIGYMLGVDFWNQGYTTEAARRMVTFGFDTLAMHRIYAEVISENLASVHVLHKLNMRQEGLLRESRWFQNRWWDICIYSILQSEWSQNE